MGKGGYRLGAGRPRQHRKTSNLLSLDARRLHREGFLTEGRLFGWQWTDEAGNQTASISLEALGDGLRVAYRIGGERDVCQVVPITRTGCTYGGHRVWFQCPHCYRRCALVYLSLDVACRKCHDLRYPSQAEDKGGRLWRKQRRLEQRLGEGWTRPKWMHHSTHDQIVAGIIDTESHREAYMVDQFQRKFGKYL